MFFHGGHCWAIVASYFGLLLYYSFLEPISVSSQAAERTDPADPPVDETARESDTGPNMRILVLSCVVMCYHVDLIDGI